MSQSSCVSAWHRWVIKRDLCSAPEVELHRSRRTQHICSFSVCRFCVCNRNFFFFFSPSSSVSSACVCSYSCVCVYSAWKCECLPEGKASKSTQQCTHFLSLVFSLSTRSFYLPPTTCSLRVMKVTHVGVIENERGSVRVRACLDW